MPTILFLTLLTFLTSAVLHPAQAQQPTKVPRIGYLTGASLSSQSPNTEAFRQGLRELGYIEEQTSLKNIGLQTERTIVCQSLPPSWFG